MTRIVNVIAMTFVGFFAALWLWINWSVWQFVPASPGDELVFSDRVLTTAGFLATTVGAGTAAVLGITIKDVAKGNGTESLAARVNTAVKTSPLLVTGILLYFFTGIVTLIVWLANPDETPDVINAFALGILGWAGGAFAAVFKAQP